MRIGELRYRVEIQSRAVVEDGQGGSSVTWNRLAKVWAAISIRSGVETETAGQVQSQGRYYVLIRDRDDVRPEMRVVWKDKTFNIVAVLPVALGRIRLECEELGDAGAI